MNCNCIIVCGYYDTGSSVVVDLLKEYEGSFCPGEFRLIKDPYGLNDLRYNLVEHWDPLNSDNAIKDFLWFTNHLNLPYSKYSLEYGMNYSSKEWFGESFMIETQRFISDIVDTSYNGKWHFSQFKQTKLERLKDKLIRLLKKSPRHEMYFCHCTEEEFDNAVKIYLERLLGLVDNTYSFAILDQGLAAQNPDNINHFFNNAKMIIVDRDPRDVYTEMLTEDWIICSELSRTHNTKLFVKWFNAYRPKVVYPDNTLRVRFEDVVINYSDTVKRIEEFLGLDPKSHINVGMYFQPQISQKNIGKYKKALTMQEQADLESLKKYFWNYE